MAIITPALAAARTSLNQRFPGRDKASDGWIGGKAHQGSRSGHNPRPTPPPEPDPTATGGWVGPCTRRWW